MRNTQRAAVVVPTAFLIAVSGLVSVPASAADDVTSPQAVVDNTNTGNGGSANITPRAVTQVTFYKDGTVIGASDPATPIAAGFYWVQVTNPSGAVTYKSTEVTTAQKAVSFDVDSSAWAVGQNARLEARYMGANIGQIGSRTQAQIDEAWATGTAVEAPLTLTVKGTATPFVRGSSATTVREGGSASVTFGNLAADREYVAVVGNQLVNTTGTGTDRTVTFTAPNATAGTLSVRLYDVTGDTLYSQTFGTTEAKIGYLSTKTPVISHNVAVTGADPVVAVSDDYLGGGSTATDGIVEVGSSATITWTGLDQPSTDQAKYELTKYVDGIKVPATPSKPNPINPEVSYDPASKLGTFSQTYAPMNLETGRKVTFELTGVNGTKLSQDVTVKYATATLNDPDALPVFAGETRNVVFSGIPEADNYVLVARHTPTNGDATTTVTPVGSLAAANAAASVLTEVGSSSFQLYALPAAADQAILYTSLNSTTAKIQWLEANARKQLAEPFVVDVVAAAPRAYATPSTYDHATQTSTTFVFDNLAKDADLIASPGDATAEYSIILTEMDKDGKVVGEQLVGADTGADTVGTAFDGVAITGFNDDTVAGGAARSVTFTAAVKNDHSYTATLYNVPLNLPLTKLVPTTPAGHILAVKGAGAVKNAAGVELSATSMDKDLVSVAPEVPSTETRRAWTGAGLDGAVIPTAFHAIPTTVDAANIFVGDWNGDGIDTPAYRTPGTNLFRFADDPSFGTAWTGPVDYGQPGDTVYVGDWDGNGTETLGLRRGQAFYLKNSLSNGVADVDFDYGRVSDEVIVGDWNDDNMDTIGVRRANIYHLRDDLEGGIATTVFDYGKPSDAALVGDWDGNGTDTISVRRGNQYYINNQFRGGEAERVATIGNADEKAVVSNLEKDGKDVIFTLRLTDVELPTAPVR